MTSAAVKGVDGNCPGQSRVVRTRSTVDINGGYPAKDPALGPTLKTHFEARPGELERATTAGKIAILRQWATQEALPILAVTAGRVDERFAGVRAVAKLLDGLDPSKLIDVNKLTERNPAYWQAMVEMPPGEPQIPNLTWPRPGPSRPTIARFTIPAACGCSLSRAVLLTRRPRGD